MINYISVFSRVQIASSGALFGGFCSVLIYCDDCNLPDGNYLGFLVVADGVKTNWQQMSAIDTT